MSAARIHIEEAQHDEATRKMLLEIRKHIVEEIVSMNPAFDYEGLDEEVAHPERQKADRHRGGLREVDEWQRNA